MKRFLILSLVVILSACVNLGDRGTSGEEELAAQEAARLVVRVVTTRQWLAAPWQLQYGCSWNSVLPALNPG